MFNKIWKEQISQQKGKLGIWKPKEELRPREEEEDRDCCKEAFDFYMAKRIEYNKAAQRRDPLNHPSQYTATTKEKWLAQITRNTSWTRPAGFFGNSPWSKQGDELKTGCDVFIKAIKRQVKYAKIDGWAPNSLHGIRTEHQIETIKMYDECMGK